MPIVLDGTLGIDGPLGTASAPSYGNTTATTTGLYFPTSTTLGLSTNGTAALTIDASQNVGIGTSSPATKLQVAGEIRNSSDLSNSADPIVYSYNGAAAGTVQSGIQFVGSGQNIRFYTASTERMRIDSSGNVGIGTSSPNDKLDVVGGNIRIASGNTVRWVDAGNIRASIQGDTSSNAIFSTAGSERMRIDSSGYMQGTVNGLGAGRIPAMQYYRLNADLAGANVNTAQNVLGVGVTLVGSTQYAFEAIYAGYKTVGTTAHTIGFGFGGTATINNISYIGFGNNTAGGFPAYANTSSGQWAYTNTASNTSFIASTGTASVSYFARFAGTVSVNAGGTFIPQYTLSAAPGGAYTTATGSYFRIWPLAASGSNVSIGTWA